MKKITWIYLSTYLSIGGLGFALAPDIALKMFLSNGEYGDVMPRVVGLFMFALGGLVATMTYNDDFRYYSYAVFIRTVMVVFFGWLLIMSQDPLFIVILGIILLGLVPSWYCYLRELRQQDKGATADKK